MSGPQSTSGVTTVNPLATLAGTPATTQIGANAGNSQMNEFLTLLTTQLKNQDPMQPTDPTQFVAQLAQFSTVEQLVQGNAKLDGIATSLSSYTLGQYAAMIGHTVGATASSVTVPASGAPAGMTFSVSQPALSNIRMQISDSSGRLLRSVAVAGSTGTVPFDGTDGQGNRLPAGTYSAALVGTDSKGATQTAGTLGVSGVVSQVLQGSGGAWQLLLADGRTVNASAVTSLQ